MTTAWLKERSQREAAGNDLTHIIRLGTVGWNVPLQHRMTFAEAGSHLERYASVLNCVEISSSFYRRHRLKTYERWAASVPVSFRFAVKIPRGISHAPGFTFDDSELDRFFAEVAGLGPKLGPLLLQLPPSAAFDKLRASALFAALQAKATAPVICEPRHASWFTPEVDAWLAARMVARVAADPARHPGAGEPGGWPGLAYFRLHGSPKIYYSSYDEDALSNINGRLGALAATTPVWCIFDNTAAGAAMDNVLALKASR